MPLTLLHNIGRRRVLASKLVRIDTRLLAGSNAADGGWGVRAASRGPPPGMNPLLNMGMGPGGLLSGMHPLANLQNQLQNFAFLQVSQYPCSHQKPLR